MANCTRLSLAPASQPPLLPPPPQKKIQKNTLKKSMFPNLHEIFYHMMCLAFQE